MKKSVKRSVWIDVRDWFEMWFDNARIIAPIAFGIVVGLGVITTAVLTIVTSIRNGEFQMVYGIAGKFGGLANLTFAQWLGVMFGVGGGTTVVVNTLATII